MCLKGLLLGEVGLFVKDQVRGGLERGRVCGYLAIVSLYPEMTYGEVCYIMTIAEARACVPYDCLDSVVLVS